MSRNLFSRNRFTLISALLAGGVLLATQTLAAAEVVLRRGNAGEPKTLDQHQTSIDVESNVLKDLYEGLAAYDGKGNVRPGVAASWDISKDGLVYTFRLRPEAKWSNGEPFKASDFVFTFRRIMDPKTGAKYANLLYPIKNAESINKGQRAPTELGVKAVDDKTLEITLERATPYFIELLTHQTGLPLNEAAVNKFGAEFAKAGNLVSNGAFQLTEFTPGQHIKLTRNPNYWDAANVKIDTVFFYPTEDQPAAMRRFLAGELDINYQFPIDQLKFLRERIGNQARIAPYIAIQYYSINTAKPPFDDVRVRRALSLALDREYLTGTIFSQAYPPAYSMVPPGLAGYDGPQLPYKGKSQLDREDEAIKLLKEVGYGPGGKPLKIEIRYNTNDNWRKMAAAIADMWKPLNAEVTLLNVDVRSHYSHLQNKGDFDVARAGWNADYADPQNIMFLGLSGNAVGNYARYASQEFDALMKKSDEEGNPAARMKLLAEAEAVLLRDMPMIPIMYNAALWLVSDKVVGWQDNLQNEHRSQYLSLKN